jgi:hypothetical protein
MIRPYGRTCLPSRSTTTGGHSGHEYRPNVASHRHPARHSGSNRPAAGRETVAPHAVHSSVSGAAAAPAALVVV